MSRSQVLSMYKRILRVGQNWVATHPDNTQVMCNRERFSIMIQGVFGYSFMPVHSNMLFV